MVQLARDQSSDCVNLTDIADREALTVAYVAKLMRILRRAGLVKSIRGVKGGYRLTDAPERVSLAQILAALGDNIDSQAFCRRHSGHARDCVHVVDCGSRAVLKGLNQMVKSYLSQFTLSDLIHPEQRVRAVVKQRVKQLAQSV
jgi:Rrf2 family protein